jgi:hypothetical protein
MVPPEMPTGLSIGEAVFDDDPDGKFDDCVGVMGTGSGKLSRIDVEVGFAFRTIMHGIAKLDIDRPSLGETTKMVEFSFAFTVFSATVTALWARAFRAYFRAFFDDGLGQIVDVIDSFRGIGQIITGTEHGCNLLETSVQKGILPILEGFVNTISQLLCYSL